MNPTHQQTTQGPTPAFWTFRRRCAAVGIAFLLLTQFGKLIYYDARGVHDYKDFPQYYMAGLIARAGAWDSLYPIPRPDTNANPGDPADSTMRPKYAQLAAEHGVGDTFRYMQPPPLALLLIPLAWANLHISFYAWTFLLALAAWGIGLQAATMYELCVRSASLTASRQNIALWLASRASGLLILLVCLSPQAHRWVRSANMNVLIGWLIGLATLSLVRSNDLANGIAVALGAIAKYALFILGPLQLAMRRWRAIAIEIILVAALLATSVIAAGSLEPYQTFARQILPTLGRIKSVQHEQSLYPTLLRILRLTAMPPGGAVAFAAAQWGMLAIILLLIATMPRRRWDRPDAAISAAMALTAWLLVFSPITWEHNFAWLAPFWGFLAYQARLSRTRCAASVIAIAFSYMPTDLIQSHKLPEPFFSHLCISAVLTMCFGTWVLWQDRRGAAAQT